MMNISVTVSLPGVEARVSRVSRWKNRGEPAPSACASATGCALTFRRAVGPHVLDRRRSRSERARRRPPQRLQWGKDTRIDPPRMMMESGSDPSLLHAPEQRPPPSGHSPGQLLTPRHDGRLVSISMVPRHETRITPAKETYADRDITWQEAI